MVRKLKAQKRTCRDLNQMQLIFPSHPKLEFYSVIDFCSIAYGMLPMNVAKEKHGDCSAERNPHRTLRLCIRVILIANAAWRTLIDA